MATRAEVAPPAGEPAEEREPSIATALLADELLARLVARGSERAFETIYDRYHQRLYRYCYSLLRDSDDAYDALQSTLVSALAALQRGQRDAPLRPWLFRIAHNEAISEFRRRGPVGEANETLQLIAPSAEERAGERARLELLAEDLRELPERERSVLVMRELSGLSHQEIAVALGISIHAVRHAIFAARRSLGEFDEGRAMICKDVRTSISHGDARVLARARARAHLRDCAGCAAFAASIPARRADLQLLAPPLAPVLAAALLASLRRTASAPGAGGGVATGIAGKTAGAAFAAKALVGVAIVASAGASIGAVSAAEHSAGQRPSGQPSGASARRAPAHPRERPPLARASRERRAPAKAVATSGVPAGASSGAQPAVSAAASGAATSSAASPGTAAAATPGPAGKRGEVGRGSSGPLHGRVRSNNARRAEGVNRRSLAGAQHARGPRKGSDTSPPLHGSGGRSVASVQHTGGSPAADLAAQSHGGQSAQPASGGQPTAPHEAPAPEAEGHQGSPAAPAPETPPPSAAEGGRSKADAAQAPSHEKP